MPVGPADLKRVLSDDLSARGADLRVDRGALDHALSRVLVHAVRAGAMKPQLNEAQRVLVAKVPGDEHFSLVLLVDSRRDGGCGHESSLSEPAPGRNSL